MNQHKAIAAVTDTLRRLLVVGRQNLPGLKVPITFGPPDRIPVDQPNRVNLFLYDTAVNASWRNMDLPNKVKPGETGYPPLALNLYYLLTAYGEDVTHANSHELLGQAMSILHDSPLLNADEIKYNDGTGEYVHQQIERIRITPQPLSLDELTKLWSTFQTPYRISTVYQVSVVLIESSRPTKTPLPVRRRGREDSDGAGGTLPDTPERIDTYPNTLPPFPTILSIETAGGQPSIELGTTLVVKGHNLAAKVDAKVELQFTHPYIPNDEPISIVVPANNRSDTEITVALDADLEKLPPGVCRLAIAMTERGSSAKMIKRSSSQFSTSVAAAIDFESHPQIPTGVPQVAGQLKTTSGDNKVVLVLAVKFNPAVLTEKQNISLLLGSVSIAFDNDELKDLLGDEVTVTGKYRFQGLQEIPEAEVEINTVLPIPTTSKVLVFILDPPPKDEWPINQLVRLRIDGIDSLLVEDRTVKPPKFRDTRVIVPGP